MELVKEKTSMAELFLDSLEVQNFRGFEHLRVERLGRVNLIVGKNNVGKTSFLEALRIYANKAQPTLLFDLLSKRDEALSLDDRLESTRRSEAADFEKTFASLRYLFYGRPEITSYSKPFRIGSLNISEKRVSLGISWFKTVQDGDTFRRVPVLPASDVADVEVDSLEPRFVIESNMGSTNLPLSRRASFTRNARLLSEREVSQCIFVPSDGLLLQQINDLWSNISLTPLENEVIVALRILAPGVEAINIVGQASHFIIVKVEGLDGPLPLRSLGNGMQRALGVALSLVNARGGILLIDELENGFHYSIQADLWRLIFRLAHLLNIQVFATTHSWDCIEGFQRAAQESEGEDGLLISLDLRKTGEMRAVLFDEQELEFVTREHIEVR